MKHLGAKPDERRQVDPGQVDAVRVAMERRVEVRAGVPDHRDDVHRKLGPGAYFSREACPSQVGRDRRRGQPRIGHESSADSDARDRRCAAPCPGTEPRRRDPRRRLPRCCSSTMRSPRSSTSSTRARPRCRTRRRPHGGLVKLGRRQVEAKPGARQPSSVGEADVEVEVGAIVGHVGQPTIDSSLPPAPAHARLARAIADTAPFP